MGRNDGCEDRRGDQWSSRLTAGHCRAADISSDNTMSLLDDMLAETEGNSTPPLLTMSADGYLYAHENDQPPSPSPKNIPPCSRDLQASVVQISDLQDDFDDYEGPDDLEYGEPPASDDERQQQQSYESYSCSQTDPDVRDLQQSVAPDFGLANIRVDDGQQSTWSDDVANSALKAHGIGHVMTSPAPAASSAKAAEGLARLTAPGMAAHTTTCDNRLQPAASSPRGGSSASQGLSHRQNIFLSCPPPTHPQHVPSVHDAASPPTSSMPSPFGSPAPGGSLSSCRFTSGGGGGAERGAMQGQLGGGATNGGLKGGAWMKDCKGNWVRAAAAVHGQREVVNANQCDTHVQQTIDEAIARRAQTRIEEQHAALRGTTTMNREQEDCDLARRAQTRIDEEQRSGAALRGTIAMNREHEDRDLAFAMSLQERHPSRYIEDTENGRQRAGGREVVSALLETNTDVAGRSDSLANLNGTQMYVYMYMYFPFPYAPPDPTPELLTNLYVYMYIHIFVCI